MRVQAYKGVFKEVEGFRTVKREVMGWLQEEEVLRWMKGVEKGEGSEEVRGEAGVNRKVREGKEVLEEV